eukprot:COSAG04_NODE_20050_length_402_cov_0.613861_1_plen_32_part_10
MDGAERYIGCIDAILEAGLMWHSLRSVTANYS